MNNSSRTRTLWPVAAVAGAFCVAGPAFGWVEFVNETSARLQATTNSLGAGDTQEKDYAWGDLNKNGWVDLVVMRRTPANNSNTQQPNVLFMNEGGVLVDRTAEYASAVALNQLPAGHTDNGFLTPISDRQAAIVDVDNDGWLDVVTSPSFNDGRPKYESHPRVYMNLGDGGGAWQGLEFQNDRYPQLAGIVSTGPHAGFPHAPRFCGINTGDVTANGYADIYFSDYSSNQSSSTFNFNDRLLINRADEGLPGHFADETSQRLPSGFTNTNFGVHNLIVDFNQNNHMDIAMITALGNPYAVRVIYAKNDVPGDYLGQPWHTPPGGGASPYFIQAGDLNNNGRIDLIIARDGSDIFVRNLSTASNGQVNWSSSTTLPNSGGFRSNVVVADLNNNGWNDILTATVDVDLYGCNNSSPGIHRNNANPPAVSFTRDLGNIPSSQLTGAYDHAVFDLTGNGWKDIIVGRCAGQAVWVQVPPFSLEVLYPDGLPAMVAPDEPSTFPVQLTGVGGSVTPGTETLHVSTDGRTFDAVSLSPLGGGLFEATLPAAECGGEIEFYVSAEIDKTLFTDPPGAPAAAHSVAVAVGTAVTFADDIEGDVSAWTIDSHPTLTGGEWEQAVPVPTLLGTQLASPDGDASPDPNGMAFVTENCAPGAAPSTCNVEEGPTHLISPVIDLDGTDAIISYDRWFFNSTAGDPATEDFLETWVSNDGGQNWVFVHQTGGTGGNWETAEFLVSNYVSPTSTVQVRFTTEDRNNTSITNAGIDNLSVEQFVCEPAPCLGDITGTGDVNVDDLLALLAAWGDCPAAGACPEDLDENGEVNVDDLLILLANWGACP